jgi:hypothetical protein
MRDVKDKITLTVRRAKQGSFDMEAGGNNVSRAIAYVEDNLLTSAEKNPDTKFHLVFPPYSRAKYALWHFQQHGAMEAHEAVVRYIARRAAELQNVIVYGFEDRDFLDDLANYKDLDHYATNINRYIAAAIRDGRNRVTTANVEAYLEEARSRAGRYDLAGLADQLNACAMTRSEHSGVE